jgi:Arc/MetJ-type ribon-helix-helix transcriptional regulator
MARRSFRLPELLEERIAEVIREDGYSSFAAFVRTAIQNELKRREQQADVAKIEQSIAEALDRQIEAQARVATTLQAHFAFTDALARMIFHDLPEAPDEVHSAALARAKERHERLLKMTAVSMKGNARAILAPLINHDE